MVNNTLRISISVHTQYRRVTDRQTSCHGIVRAMHMRRAVKAGLYFIISYYKDNILLRYTWVHIVAMEHEWKLYGGDEIEVLQDGWERK